MSIRNLTEVIHDRNSVIDLFDSQQGGAGIARPLVAGDDGENFEMSAEFMPKQFVCDFGDGRPHCLYKCGFDTRNRSDTFDRDRLLELLYSRLELV